MKTKKMLLNKNKNKNSKPKLKKLKTTTASFATKKLRTMSTWNIPFFCSPAARNSKLQSALRKTNEVKTVQTLRSAIYRSLIAKSEQQMSHNCKIDLQLPKKMRATISQLKWTKHDHNEHFQPQLSSTPLSFFLNVNLNIFFLTCSILTTALEFCDFWISKVEVKGQNIRKTNEVKTDKHHV